MLQYKMLKGTSLNAVLKSIYLSESNSKQNETDDLGKLIWQQNEGEM